MRLRLIFLFVLLQSICGAQIFTTINGYVDFISDAPLEVINASSYQMQGVLDVNNKSFIFKMYIKSFDGFNSQLQKVHFYENYMEANDYPIAIFKGKILEEILPDRAEYRAKGMLIIHGVEVNRIINLELDVGNKSINYLATFKVALTDHDIHLPRIVYQKIAEEISVNVNGIMNIKE